MTAIVELDYTAKDSSELTVGKGAIITNIKELPGGRYEGTCNGRIGIIPENVIKFLHNDEKVTLRDKSATVNRRCKAVYSYTQNNDDELSLGVGDIIEFLGEVEEGWWRGKLRNKVGVFPSNFVVTVETSPVPTTKNLQSKKSINDSKEDLMSTLASVLAAEKEKDAPILPPKPVSPYRSSKKVDDEIDMNLAKKFREVCQVMYPYKPASDDELELIAGDIITILIPDEPSKHGRPPIPSKIISSKSPSSANHSSNSHRKDSFGSKDSLNDPPPIQMGHVAAHRLSLENRASTIEITSKGFESTKASSDLRKSMENLDERKSSVPPVLTKKPSVPIKKSPTIGSVTGSLFSGIKQKVKGGGSVDHKNHNNNTSHDSFDGIGGSKMNATQVADNVEKGVVGERFRKDESDFNTVERSSILQDVRASRAKAPKRRLPTGQSSYQGDTSSITLNGSSLTESTSESPPSNAEEEKEAKPKPREWEKHKAPWMAELKLSQMKKTQTGSVDGKVEPHKTTDSNYEHEPPSLPKMNDMSKSFSTSYVGGSSHRKSIESGAFEIRANSVEVRTKELPETSMTKSMSSGGTKISIDPIPTLTPSSTPTAVDDHKSSRPLSVSLRNRSISPIGRTVKSIHVPAPSETAVTTTPSIAQLLNNNHHNSTGPTNCEVTTGNDSSSVRIVELENRLAKLEKFVQSQAVIIDDLVKTLKDEKDKVKVLKTELDKYAQCVTQV